MKLKSENIEFLDLTEQSDDEFWNTIRGLMRYGIPAYDGKGHSSDLRIKVRPLQIDMIAAIKEKCPDGWYKSQAALVRALIAIGCKVAFKMLSLEDSQWNDVLSGLNRIAKNHRLEEFKRDTESLKDDIAKGPLPPQEKLKLLDTVTRLQDSMYRM